MRYSQLFGKTVKEAQRGAVNTSTTLLYRAGFIREIAAGRYSFLPLGFRVHDRIMQVVREEMDRAGAQEMSVPVLHPLELWKETNRTNTAGFELMKVKDRREAEFALGGTAEEMFVDVVRKFQISYRDLPFNIYQFSLKFRDELRARGGLLRVREFVMKDAYSFDRNEEEFKRTYKLMEQTYTRIFERLGLKTYIVEADNGYIGGEYCHEFVVESEAGESKFLVTPDGSYCAHEEVAKFQRDEKNLDEPIKEYAVVDAVRGTTMEDGVKLHGLPMWQQIKDLMMVDEKGRLILAVIRGDLEVNEVKLAQVTGSISLRHATAEEIRSIGSEPGFICPVGLKGKAMIVGDISLRTVRNAYGGANKLNRDAVNINIDRDYVPDIEGDIALAKAGYISDLGQKMTQKTGIEVGNIFQLGYHYTRLMKGATFMDEDGSAKPYYMGCYGIGIGRTLAAIVEAQHDDKGILWPEIVAPFRAHLINIGVSEQAKSVYDQLVKAGIDVVWDDREDVSAGEKFADADLIGIPVRLVVSTKTGTQVEWKRRGEPESKLVDVKKAKNDLQ